MYRILDINSDECMVKVVIKIKFEVDRFQWQADIVHYHFYY